MYEMLNANPSIIIIDCFIHFPDRQKKKTKYIYNRLACEVCKLKLNANIVSTAELAWAHWAVGNECLFSGLDMLCYTLERAFMREVNDWPW